jgi:Ca2+-binding EF-hand superfamily protein
VSHTAFAEYAQLHKFVLSMEAAFRKFDRDRNGRLDKLEITNALREGGFHFNPATANTLMRKFATGAAATTGVCTRTLLSCALCF